MTIRRHCPCATKPRHVTLLRSALAIATLYQVHNDDRNVGVVFVTVMSTDSLDRQTCRISYCHLKNIHSIRLWMTKQAATRTIIWCELLLAAVLRILVSIDLWIELGEISPVFLPCIYANCRACITRLVVRCERRKRITP